MPDQFSCSTVAQLGLSGPNGNHRYYVNTGIHSRFPPRGFTVENFTNYHLEINPFDIYKLSADSLRCSGVSPFMKANPCPTQETYYAQMRSGGA